MNLHATSGVRYELGGWNDPAYELVRKMSDLSDGCKISWDYLWITSRGAMELVRMMPEMVGRERGRGADAGREDLKNLAAAGLIIVIERPSAVGNRVTNGWLLQVLDPIELHHEQLRRVDPDAQLELGFEQRPHSDADGSARPMNDGPSSPGLRDQRALGCVASDAGRDASLRPTTFHPPPGETLPANSSETLPAKSRWRPIPEGKMKSFPLPLPELERETKERERLQGKGRNETRRDFAGKVSPATPIGDAIGEALNRIADQTSAPTRQREVTTLFESIRKRVNCPRFDEFTGLSLIASEALVDRRFPLRELEACLRYVDRIEREKKLLDTRSQCFNGALRVALLRHGIDPTGGRPAR